MPGWIRIGIAVIVGVVIGGSTLAVVEMVAHKVTSDTGLFVSAAVGLGIAAITGGIAAVFIGQKKQLSFFVAGLLGCLSLVNVFSFPHPVWFVPIAFALLGAGSYFASRLVATNKGVKQ